jgi:hypothetical protein
MEKGRTTPEDAWRGLPEVSAAAHSLRHAKYVVAEYSQQMKSFEHDHPVKAALGLSPTMYDSYGIGGGEQRLSGHLRAAEANLREKSVAWERVRAQPDLRAKARDISQAQNERFDVAARKLPKIEQALKERAPQHKQDQREQTREFNLERERSRELDRGMDLGR